MNNYNNYLERKIIEINYLRNEINLPNVDNHNLNANISEWVVIQKYKLRSYYKKKFFDDNQICSETNFSNKKIHISSSVILETQYQRFDLKVLLKKPLLEVYRINKNNVNSVCFFTTSGMGAITSLINGLKKGLTEKWGIYIENDSYFETLQLLKIYYPEINVRHDKFDGEWDYKIFWYDSISEKSFFDISRKIETENINLIVIDSTCYSIGSEQISSIVDYASKNKIPCAFVRSHIKLDTLALEYGRLGSLLFFFNDISSNMITTLSKISAHSKEFCSRTGLNFMPENILGLFYNDCFHKLNNNRINLIKRNTNTLYLNLASRLENLNYFILNYQHSLFLTIEYTSDNEKINIEEEKSKLRKYLNSKNIDAREATSFCFDFHALDSYLDYFTKKQRIRFSPSDGPKSEILNIAKYIVSYLREFHSC